MAKEDLVELIERNTQGHDALDGSLAHVEDELVTVTELDKVARRRLLGSRHGHTGSQGDHPHLVGLEFLRPGVIDVTHRIRLRA